MIRRSFLVVVLAISVAAVFGVKTSFAMSLKVTPLSYTTTLKSGERKKGFIDISNPSDSTVKVKTSVQAFKQIDNKGDLQFYDDDQFEKGVLLDLKTFELRQHEALRMYFLLDGKKLPSGDIFGAIFFTVEQSDKEKLGVHQALRVGTLLSIMNGTPGPRDAKITGLHVPFFQAGSTIRGSVTVKNTANSQKDTGFYPELALRLWPGKVSQTFTSSLLFAGHTRVTDFETKDVGFGLHKITVSYKGSTKTTWVVTAEPFTVIIIGVIVGTILLETVLWLRRRHVRATNTTTS